jgi:hypothetical protein
VNCTVDTILILRILTITLPTNLNRIYQNVIGSVLLLGVIIIAFMKYVQECWLTANHDALIHCQKNGTCCCRQSALFCAVTNVHASKPRCRMETALRVPKLAVGQLRFVVGSASSAKQTFYGMRHPDSTQQTTTKRKNKQRLQSR